MTRPDWTPTCGRSALCVRALSMLVAACAGFVLASCGYNAGLRAAERRSTVALEIFGNDSYERDLERPIHDGISRALRELTDLDLVSTKEAEIVIRGTVSDFHRRSGIRSIENRMLETGVYVEVEASLIEAKSGRALGPPSIVGTWIGYTLSEPGNEPAARERAFRHLADELVLELFAPTN